MWSVLVALFLTLMLTTPAGFIFLELLDRTETPNSQEFDDVTGQAPRLRFVRDPKVAVSPDHPEPSALDAIPPSGSPTRPSFRTVSAFSCRFEHRSTLSRRSRAPGAPAAADRSSRA